MTKKFEDLLESLSYDELMELKKDIDSSAPTTKRIVEDKIKKKMKEYEKACSTCSSTLRFYSSNNYSLIFGPDDFKKKASFCGIDCLEYFLSKLKNIKSKKDEESEEDHVH